MSTELVAEPAPPTTPPLTAAQITDDITRPLFTKPPLAWHGAIAATQGIAALLVIAIAMYCIEGYGIFGVNQPVNWGNDITTYIFWIGIAVAGTLVSSVLFLFRQTWRTAVNRSTEAMTVFAVQIAGLFPLIHTGRPWVDFWLLPYGNDRHLWPNLKSAIVWDVFALTAYATTSIIFWYFGLIPDFATVRDRAKNKWQRMIYSVLAMGWRGKANDWVHYERAYAQFAWIATPLVVGMHSTIAILAAVGKIPGWHATIFGPYFVSGAIFGGLAMAIVFLIPMRSMLKLQQYITLDHLEKLAKVMLVCGLLVNYVYVMEYFSAWWSESNPDRHIFIYRVLGNWWFAGWIMLACNFVIPQLLWFRAIRRNLFALMGIAIAVNIGMWFERFVIISLSVMQDHLPSSWDYSFSFRMFDHFVLFGSFGLFFFFILGFFLGGASDLHRGDQRHTLRNPSTVAEATDESKAKSSASAAKPIVAGYYRDQSRFTDACGAATTAGLKPEAFTPWPVHGLEAKLGIPRSTLGRPVLTVILIGFALGLYLVWYTQYQNYPLNVGGKPYFAWQTFVVVIMETGLLLGALANMGIALHLCRLLPDPFTRLINDRITDDTFALVLPISAAKDAENLSAWLRAQGAEEVQVLGVIEPALVEEPAHA